MASERKGSGRNTKLVLRGLKQGDECPEIEVSLFDHEGNVMEAVTVGNDGSFNLPASAVEKAHRVRIGPGGEASKEAPSTVYLSYRAADFNSVLDASILNIGRRVWQEWLFFYRCVSGTVSRCRRSPWWYAELARATMRPVLTPRRALFQAGESLATGRFARAARIPDAFNLDQLIAWPVRCSPICLGTVEVYKRICCCKPWVFTDDRFERLKHELEDLLNGIPEIPDFPDPPGPDPDPAPYRAAFLRDGALDERALRAGEDLQALRSLPSDRIVEYVNARPYLLCRHYDCSDPIKVAEGMIGPDGRFNICWSEFPKVLRAGCHVEYAYKVKQRIGPFTVTIYNGLAAGHWHDSNDEVALKSYHPWAIACRDNGGQGDAFVYLDEIGDTDSSLLGTPDQTNAVSVANPGLNGGVAFPSGGPAGNGSHDRNWGGTLKLAMMFSESMRNVGAKYYRVSVTETDSSGNPVGAPEYVTKGLSWNKAVAVPPSGVDVVPVSLGPTSTTAPDEPQDNLYEIPFDGDLGLNADWEADQYHVELNTADALKLWSDPGAIEGQPAKRHLVTVEVFNATGQRLRPNGTPPSGLPGAEIEVAFTYRRKFQDTGPTNMVPFGALTHLFWWDNRDVVASIENLRMDGLASDEQCQFLNGTSTSTFGIGYRAYHPWELFQKNHVISWKRGLNGGSDTLLNSTTNVGVPPASEGASLTHTFGHMLDHPVATTPPRTKCAFSVFLTTYNKRTDGDDLDFGRRHDNAAFALDIAPEVCLPCSSEEDDD
ncbi:MAG: hypothetical protein LC541_17275 [Candidatus Thiodiazotropha sp.]|nr:hypothetical protein [Candidatus Thiodiazotropha sp.]MCM8885022.1 hypothetical protein [Candidatus Thiodiazotropha sp.]MCM8921042.1 hypothetical protein [Candidatus Thiodiazotropha sp.]